MCACYVVTYNGPDDGNCLASIEILHLYIDACIFYRLVCARQAKNLRAKSKPMERLFANISFVFRHYYYYYNLLWLAAVHL